MKKRFFAASIIVLVLLFIPLITVYAQSETLPLEEGQTLAGSYVDAAVAGVPLTILVFGLVAFLKLQGIKGRALLFSSLGSGLLFGAGYMVYQTRPPIGDWWSVYGYWFGVVIYGLGLGLLASGVYEGIKSGVSSVLSKFATPDGNG